MEAEDFVADSDEDEQEMLEALALAEEQRARQLLDAEVALAAASGQLVPAHEQERVAAVVTPERPPTVQEQPPVQSEAQEETVEEQKETEEVTDEEQEEGVTDEEQEGQVTDEEQEEQGTDEEQEQQENGVLEVGTLVDVDSRTWPGINKLGGSGRVVRVHVEKGEGGEEEAFYDVRYYVMGGFEKLIESKYVHSSSVMKKQSNRKRVDRDYYHDDYINEPYRKKLKADEKKRERMMAHPEQGEAQVLHRRKRKRPRRSDRSQRVHNKPEDDQLSSKDKARKQRTVSKIDEEMFVLTNSARSSLEVSNRPLSERENAVVTAPTARSPELKKPVRNRRSHRILDSSDEESSDDGDGDKAPVSPKRPENQHPMEAYSSASLASESGAPVTGDSKPADPIYEQRGIHKRSRRRYVGGYERYGDEDDGGFIQPEGNPSELPEDVARELGVRLATTKHELIVQLQDTFSQQQKNMVNFHAEQNAVNQKMKDLSGMPLTDLQELRRKVLDLNDIFLTKTLVNAGEDVMDAIINKLEKKRGKLPTSVELLDSDIGVWKDELKECSRWVRDVTNAVEDAFARRGEDIPIAAQAEYSSDSADDFDARPFQNETADIDKAFSDGVDFSYDYEPENVNDVGRQKRQLGHASKAGSRHPRPSKAAKRSHLKKLVTSTTLDDYFPRQGSGNDFRSNLRLVGRQKKILPSDPRWNWINLARKKQQRAGSGMRLTGTSSVQFSNGLGARGIQETHLINTSRSRDDSVSVQAQRLHLRDKRFRMRQSKHQSREKAGLVRSAPQALRSISQQVYPAGITFDDVTPEKRLRPAGAVNPTIHPSSSKQQLTNWQAVFDVVSDDSNSLIDGDVVATISRQGQEALLAFGHPICGPLAPRHLFYDEEFEFEDSESFRGIVTRQVARLRQRMNDLRLQENSFMDSLSRGGLGAFDEDGYANTPEWILLVSLEETYHLAIASFAAQLLEALEGVSPADLPSHLQIVLEEVASLIRQLPDCDSLFSGCKAYFFFFEVASKDAATTPLFTAVSRGYWYSLTLLINIRSTCSRLVEAQTTSKQVIEDIFLKTLPVNRVTLAVVLFLFDLYVYLPSSHRLGEGDNNVTCNGPLPALSLWILVRSCCTSSVGLDQLHQESLLTKEKHLWALLLAVYRQRYFDELARCFIRSDSCGGYLREFTPSAADGDSEDYDEVFESQLLAQEATWGLVAVLSHIYSSGDDAEHDDAVCDAKWAVVKDLLHPGKRDFLPFSLLLHRSSSLQQDYLQCADIYKQHVLKRITAFSKQWRPCTEVVELLVRELWTNDAPNPPDEIVELPHLLKKFVIRSKELRNSRSQLAAFAGVDSEDDQDSTTELCRIIWIQLLKLEKRAHRGRFRRSILSAIPFTPDNHESSAALTPSASIQPRKPGTNWIWGPQQQAPVSTQPAKQLSVAALQRAQSNSGAGKERMSTAVLLTFAIVGVCLECNDEQQFPIDRSNKEVRYMVREVDFYCKEILRWTSGKPECEVLAAQALFTFGSLLLDKNSTEFPTIFLGLNDRLKSSMKNLQKDPLVSPTPKQATVKIRRFHSAAMTSLYHMRDLVKKMLDTPSSGVLVGPAFGLAVEKSLEHVFGAGMEACLNGAIHKLVTGRDLDIAIEIFQLVLPRTLDEPKKCFALVSTPRDEFEDGIDYAGFDMAGILDGLKSTPAPAWKVKECRPKVIHLIASNLRVAVQQLVLNYPQSGPPGFAELYAIDLLGMLLSTCAVQFLWSNVTSTSAKPRNLAPRVLSAAMKYNPEKEWLSNVFLRESGADQVLSTAWLLGTLDSTALNPTPIVFRLKGVPFAIGDALVQEAITHQQRVRDSDYWAMLTDGIIYHLLRNDSPGFGAMDPQMVQFLRKVASTCKFPAAVRANEAGLHDVATLYDLHLDVFQSFCRSAGRTWSLYAAATSINRHQMNQFRTKMVNTRSGIFVAFLDAYKINFRRACGDIDQVNHDWHSFAKLFLRQAGVNATDGRSYHEMDDTIKSFDQRLTGLTTMFQFMYQCMDAFLFYCGEMAIGENNLFFNAMELLFRQVNSAEYPQAIKRLANQRDLDKRGGVLDVNNELRKGFCPAAMGFADSVQLFFARQKYPSLLHWFAQTSEIYQTFKSGWRASPLRTLLVNILDPDGPLGIHSYYPGDEASKDSRLLIDVRTVRREAFYLSCGLFNCRCTKSFEHSRARPAPSSCVRIQQLRGFVLDDFMRDSFSFVQEEDTSSVLETMVPLCQFVRAVLNHANLNANTPRERQSGAVSNVDGPVHQDFQLSELQPCLEWIVECLIKLVPGDEAVNSTISCVLLIELCGIMCEAIVFNEHRPMLELIDLVELVLSYLQTVYAALSKRTTAVIGTLFVPSVELPPSVKLNEYHFSPSAFRKIVVERLHTQKPSAQMESYEISLARASTDLLAGIGRVAQHCKESSDERLQGLTTVSS